MKNKSSRARMQVIFGSLLLVAVLIAEMYVMIHFPNQFLAIVVMGVLALVCAYMVIDGILVMQGESEAKRNEQNEYIYKSEKAAFLVSKKNFEHLGERLDELEQSMKLSSEEVINAQKGIAKVSINRSRENAEALMNSNDLVLEQIKELAGRLDELSKTVADHGEAAGLNDIVSASRDAVIESQKKISELNEKALHVQGQELIVNMKDMELRLSQAMMQIQKAQQIPVYSEPAQPITLPDQEPQPEEISLEAADSDIGQPELDEVFAEAEAALTGMIDELPEVAADVSELPQEGAVPEPELELSVGTDIESEAAEPVMEFESEPELPVEPDMEPEPVIDIEPELSAELDIEPESVIDIEPEPELSAELDIEPEPAIELAAESELPDLSDPNKPLSLDEIDALFANMGVETTKPAEEPKEPEPVFEPDLIIGSELISELAEQMPGEAPEPIKEMPEPEPVMEAAAPDSEPKDANRALSFSEIDALFESMGIGDTSDLEPVEEAVSEPEPEVAEEKPKMPDLSDPNKAMSPEDIAALIANMA